MRCYVIECAPLSAIRCKARNPKKLRLDSGSIPVRRFVTDPFDIHTWLRGKVSSNIHLLRMREGIYWRGSNQARRRQQECNPDQSFVLPSRRQARRRRASVLVVCLILCSVAWTLSRFRSPSPTSTESLPRQAPARAVVFELFRHYRHLPAHNETFSVLAGPVHRRRRGLLEHSGTTALTDEEMFSEEEPAEQAFEGQTVDDNLTVEFASLEKKMTLGYHNYHEPLARKHDQDSSFESVEECPLFGGHRASDLEIESFFVKVELGYGTQMREYTLSIDSGSGITWVSCKGRGPIASVGPNGLFQPKGKSFLNCKKNQDLCLHFQDGEEHPCDRKHRFRCLFTVAYGDKTGVQGSVVVGDVSFKFSDGSREEASLAFGCADVVTTDWETVNVIQESVPFDGLLGLGPHPASWLFQLNTLGIISEYAIAVCLEPEIGHILPDSGLEQVGFISFGNSYARQAANIAWTATIPSISSNPRDNDNMHTGMLVGFKYRDDVHLFERMVKMGFDTGSDLTYLTMAVFNPILEILNEDAIRMGYVEMPDRHDRVGENRRNCWQDIIVGRESSVKNFGDLIMMFRSRNADYDTVHTTSDFVIKPEHYITLGGPPSRRRICFNMRVEKDYDYGNLGGEAMRGHLLIFLEDPSKPSDLIGWSSVTSCKNLRDIWT